MDIIGVKADDYEIGEIDLVVEGELIYFEGLGRDDNRVFFVERHFEEDETPPSYEDLIRNPNQWHYNPITFKAEVGHVLEEEGNYYVLQMNTSWNNQLNPNSIMIQYTKGFEESRILPGDRMVFWGYSTGLGEFINENGQTVYLPMATVNTMINTGSSVMKTTPAIKDFDTDTVYYIMDGKNFITAMDSKTREEVIKPLEGEKKLVDKQIESYMVKKKRVFDLYEDGHLPKEMLAERLKEIETTLEQMEVRQLDIMDKIKMNSSDQIPFELVKETMEDFNKLLNSADKDQRKMFLQLIVNKITVGDNRKIDTIEIHFNETLKNLIKSFLGEESSDDEDSSLSFVFGIAI